MKEKNTTRNYKDSVFVDLFSEDERAKENFLSLYNALHKEKLTGVEGLKNIRLEQVLYMSFMNDVSYLVEDKIIVLAEHQSSINPNMPLRCLEYVVRLYEKLYEAKEKYSRKAVRIPAPEFYVFYNGKTPYPCDQTLKLSQAFVEPVGKPSLELIVKVVNINRQKEHSLLETCKPMREYSIFVQTVRKWQERDPVNGFQKAIEECIANDILREYLIRKSKEVINMLIGEYDYEMDIAVQRAEEREIAFAEGIEQGIERGLAEGKSLGIAEGKSLGLAEGKSLGLAEGKSLGLAEGMQQGAYRTKCETAKNLMEMGLSIESIAKATGLSQAEVAALQL